MAPIRVLVADDAVVVRRLLTSVIDADPDLEVVGVAQNGRVALTKIEQLKPDIVTLDIEMPVLDGLAALRELRARDRDLPVIMFSTLTARGAAATMEALTLGASDYVTKPSNVGSASAAMDSVRRELVPRIKALCMPAAPVVAPPTPVRPLIVDRARVTPRGRIDVVAIGASTGGPNALSTVLGALPSDLAVPVVITQHMPPIFTRILAERIDGGSAISVREAAQGDLLRPGTVLVAPGGHHMTFERGAAGVRVVLDDGPEENYCRPSVDVMLRSLAKAYNGDALVVMMTGMGHDGRDGTALIKQLGAKVIVQDQASSVVWGMPGAVHAAGLADEVLPLARLGPVIAERVLTARAHTRAGLTVGARP